MGGGDGEVTWSELKFQKLPVAGGSGGMGRVRAWRLTGGCSLLSREQIAKALGRCCSAHGAAPSQEPGVEDVGKVRVTGLGTNDLGAKTKGHVWWLA